MPKTTPGDTISAPFNPFEKQQGFKYSKPSAYFIENIKKNVLSYQALLELYINLNRFEAAEPVEENFQLKYFPEKDAEEALNEISIGIGGFPLEKIKALLEAFHQEKKHEKKAEDKLSSIAKQSDEERIFLSHKKLVNQLKELNHITNKKGMCFGFAHMVLQATLLNDMNTLNQRLKILSEIPDGELLATIDNAEQRRKEKHHIARMKLQKEWEKNLTNDEKLSFEKRLTLENQSTYYSQLSDRLTEADKQLDEKDCILLSIPAFFDGIALYSDAFNYPHLFETDFIMTFVSESDYEEKKPNSRQVFFTPDKKGGYKCKMMLEEKIKVIDISKEKLIEKFGTEVYNQLFIPEASSEQMIPLVSTIKEILTDSEPIFKKNLLPKHQDAALVFSRLLPNELLEEKIKHQTASTVFTNPPWAGIYDKGKLFLYFKMFEDAFNDEKINKPVVFTLNTSHHTITITWDPLSQLWCHGNANHIERIIEKMDKEKLASTVLSSFKNKGITSFITTAYGDHSISKKLEKALKKCQSSEAWKLIHCLVDNKESDDNLYPEKINMLFLATLIGDIKTAELLLRAGVKNDESIMECFYVAIIKGNFDIVNLLLSHGADPTKKSADGTSPLYLAAEHGNFDIVKLLLKNNPYPDKAKSIAFYIDQEDSSGITPLTIAALGGYTDIVKLLLDHGADIDSPDIIGMTPIHKASQAGHADVVQLLLNQGANIHQTSSFCNMTPLYLASQEGHIEIVDLLLEQKGFNINTISAAEIKSLRKKADEINRTTQLQKLLTDKEVKENTFLEGFSPLHAAAFFGQTKVVKTLLAHGANPNIQSQGNISPLELAAAMGHHSICHVLKQEMLGKRKKLQTFLHEVISGYNKEDTLSKTKKKLLQRCINILESPQEEKNIDQLLVLALRICLQLKSSWHPKNTTTLGIKIRKLLKKPAYAIIADSIKQGPSEVEYKDFRNFILRRGGLEIDSKPLESNNIIQFFRKAPDQHFEEIEKTLNSLESRLFEKRIKSHIK
jgi:ankyrin repeat protein